MKIKNLICISLLIIGCNLYSCKKKNNSCQYYIPPNSLFFQIINNGEKLPDNVINELKLYYLKDGTKIYILDFSPAIGVLANQGIMTTREIGTLGEKNYILEYGNGLENDTLYVNYSDETRATNCQYILRQIKFNNTIVTPDTSFHYQPVYVFYKK